VVADEEGGAGEVGGRLWRVAGRVVVAGATTTKARAAGVAVASTRRKGAANERMAAPFSFFFPSGGWNARGEGRRGEERGREGRRTPVTDNLLVAADDGIFFSPNHGDERYGGGGSTGRHYYRY
jgi:hypothetical protein